MAGRNEHVSVSAANESDNGLWNGERVGPDVGDAPDMVASFVSSLSFFYGLTISVPKSTVKRHPTAEIT
jgi:hypothetical protein